MNHAMYSTMASSSWLRVRVVVRNGFSYDLGHLLLDGLRRRREIGMDAWGWEQLRC